MSPETTRGFVPPARGACRILKGVGRLLLVYTPVIAAAVAANIGLPLGGSLLAIGAGLFLWTLLEYGIHRFAFHGFLPHYQHHEDPKDEKYIVSPLWLSGGTSLALWAVMRIPAGTWARSGLTLAAIIAGYLVYEAVHLRIHSNAPGGAAVEGPAQAPLLPPFRGRALLLRRHHAGLGPRISAASHSAKMATAGVEWVR